MGGCDLMTTLRNGQPITDAQLLGRINVIGFGKRGHRYTSAAGDAHERLTGLHHVNVSARLGLRSVCRRVFRRSRHVARYDQPLTRPDLTRFTNAVGLHKGGHRHAVFARDALDRLAVTDRHGRTAVPGPMTGSRPRHIGILSIRMIAAGARRVCRRCICRRGRRCDGRRLAALAEVEPRHGRPLSTSVLRRPRSVADDQSCRNWSRSARSPNNRRRLYRPARELQRAAMQAGETPPWGTACGYSLVHRKCRVRINQPRVNKRLRINELLPMKFERTKMSR